MADFQFPTTVAGLAEVALGGRNSSKKKKKRRTRTPGQVNQLEALRRLIAHEDGITDLTTRTLITAMGISPLFMSHVVAACVKIGSPMVTTIVANLGNSDARIRRGCCLAIKKMVKADEGLAEEFLGAGMADEIPQCLASRVHDIRYAAICAVGAVGHEKCEVAELIQVFCDKEAWRSVMNSPHWAISHWAAAYEALNGRHRLNRLLRRLNGLRHLKAASV